MGGHPPRPPALRGSYPTLTAQVDKFSIGRIVLIMMKEVFKKTTAGINILAVVFF